ncbi:hypothetical protein EGO58_05970 [Limosilactobacillus reuteri]|nr:hypothetical protein EGO58_05970 [Limosilactobacillus reuteri]
MSESSWCTPLSARRECAKYMLLTSVCLLIVKMIGGFTLIIWSLIRCVNALTKLVNASSKLVQSLKTFGKESEPPPPGKIHPKKSKKKHRPH